MGLIGSNHEPGPGRRGFGTGSEACDAKAWDAQAALCRALCCGLFFIAFFGIKAWLRGFKHRRALRRRWHVTWRGRTGPPCPLAALVGLLHPVRRLAWSCAVRVPMPCTCRECQAGHVAKIAPGHCWHKRSCDIALCLERSELADAVPVAPYLQWSRSSVD